MTKRLLTFFTILPTAEQTILQILAVIYAPINQASLLILLKSLDGFDTKIIALLDRSLQNRLQKNELLINTSNGDWQCQHGIAEALMRMSLAKPWFTKLAQLLIADNTSYSHHSEAVIAQHRLKKLRIFWYQGNDTGFSANLARFYQDFPHYFRESMQQIFFDNFDATWFASVSGPMRFLVLKYTLNAQRWSLQDVTGVYQLLENDFGHLETQSIEVVQCVIEQRLLRGQFTALQPYLTQQTSYFSLELLGVLHFMQHRYDQALEYLLLAEKQHKSTQLHGFASYLLCLCLLHSKTPQNLNALRQRLQNTVKRTNLQDDFYQIHQLLLLGLDEYQGLLSQTQQMALFDTTLSEQFKKDNKAYEHLFYVLLIHWLGKDTWFFEEKKNGLAIDVLATFNQQAHRQGYAWYAAVSAALLKTLAYKNKACEQIAKHYQRLPQQALLDLLPQVTHWERSLHALSQLGDRQDHTRDVRLIWLLTVDENGVSLEPKEQRLSKSGKWTKGRVVTLKRLYSQADIFDDLSEQDKKLCTLLFKHYEQSLSTSNLERYLCDEQCLLALVNHPYIYWAEQSNYDTPMSIDVTEPQLLVQAQADSLQLSLLPNFTQDQSLLIQKTTDGLLLTQINAQHRRVAQILATGLQVPLEAKSQVLDVITRLLSVITVQSDIGGSLIHTEPVAVDSRLHLHLQPIGQGLQIEVFVQPFFEGGPLYKPAEGGLTVLTSIANRHLQTRRNFDLEAAHVQQLLGLCPILEHNKMLKWQLDDPEDALETLLRLQASDACWTLEWPKGRKIKLGREMKLGQAKFSIRQEQNWFSMEGEIAIDQQQTIGLHELIQLLKNTSGRFLTLSDGQIIALTDELRKRLIDLAALGDVQADGLRFHPLSTPLLNEMTCDMNLQSSPPWQAQLERLKELETREFIVPEGLCGELRDYQYGGFQWLSRLAYWGAGACLADDMGLGKTVQALALILSRANGGPTLILAPTSVCLNWLEETVRFAPSLKVYQFGIGDRQAMLSQATAGDLIICSYGLLQTEAKRLAQVHWHTLVADEAQAIKNHATKRSKAAMALKADFKMVTTGTPIENHLGELWNLFNFINPGLLGSWAYFSEHYAYPIESQRDRQAQQRLKQLLRPFILRRLKIDVLKELPARTEVTLHVELSEMERALYETLRTQAVAMMDAASLQPAGQQQLMILAEIMKLRRACCHPRLILENSSLSSAKLLLFEELVDELLENEHKALVFSQFVGHLAIIAELLNKKGIRYQYLDGSTPAAERKRAVNSFQAGDGELFLISLKAGGTGLNLTAADYVIHTDPWWNPAVEDQASDRAHRMGQQKPVTIYRLVAKNTIEEKIVALHHQKRDLANQLLEGGDVSGKLSIEAMLALLKA